MFRKLIVLAILPIFLFITPMAAEARTSTHKLRSSQRSAELAANPALAEFTHKRKVSVAGEVITLPGMISSQTFLISLGPGKSIPVYLRSKEFPDMQIGDTVAVAGAVSITRGEKRISVKEGTNIRVIKRGGLASAPMDTSISDLPNKPLNAWLQVRGEITERTAGHIYLDDGSGEVFIPLKKNMRKAKSVWKLGDRVRVTGILGRTKKGEVQLIPMSIKDLETASSTYATTTAFTNHGRADLSVIKKYLIATVAGLLTVLAAILIKMRWNPIFVTLFKRSKNSC